MSVCEQNSQPQRTRRSAALVACANIANLARETEPSLTDVEWGIASPSSSSSSCSTSSRPAKRLRTANVAIANNLPLPRSMRPQVRLTDVISSDDVSAESSGNGTSTTSSPPSEAAATSSSESDSDVEIRPVRTRTGPNPSSSVARRGSRRGRNAVETCSVTTGNVPVTSSLRGRTAARCRGAAGRVSRASRPRSRRGGSIATVNASVSADASKTANRVVSSRPGHTVQSISLDGIPNVGQTDSTSYQSFVSSLDPHTWSMVTNGCQPTNAVNQPYTSLLASSLNSLDRILDTLSSRQPTGPRLLRRNESTRDPVQPLPSPPGQPAHVPPPVENSQIHNASTERSSARLVYPPFPEVTLTALPFLDVLDTMIRPCALQPRNTGRFQQQSFGFFLTAGQVEQIMNSRQTNGTTCDEVSFALTIQVRFSVLDTSTAQPDQFPPALTVKVNNKSIMLPPVVPSKVRGVLPSRQARPLNVTPYCRLVSASTNYIDVAWISENSNIGYTISTYLVKQLNSHDLLGRLISKGSRDAEHTRALIRDKLNDADCDVVTTTCIVSLQCPLARYRMNYPCRASTCDHLQCFDAASYLMMNEKKQKWLCPVCNKLAAFANLELDGYFFQIISSPSLPSGVDDVVLTNDGSWLLPNKADKGDSDHVAESDKSDSHSVPTVSTISATGSVQSNDVCAVPMLKSEPFSMDNMNGGPSTEVEVICLDDDDDDVSVPPPTVGPSQSAVGECHKIDPDGASSGVCAQTSPIHGPKSIYSDADDDVIVLD